VKASACQGKFRGREMSRLPANVRGARLPSEKLGNRKPVDIHMRSVAVEEKDLRIFLALKTPLHPFTRIV
jgi:hypothetical protein